MSCNGNKLNTMFHFDCPWLGCGTFCLSCSTSHIFWCITRPMRNRPISLSLPPVKWFLFERKERKKTSLYQSRYSCFSVNNANSMRMRIWKCARVHVLCVCHVYMTCKIYYTRLFTPFSQGKTIPMVGPTEYFVFTIS